jgi:uncharacterized coiled-coil DUF342 family protein
MKYNPEAMRARFAELQAQAEAIRAKSGPLREKRDALVNEAGEKERALNEKIAEAEAGLFEIDNEIALISRALGGKTGEPEAVAEETPAAE